MTSRRRTKDYLSLEKNFNLFDSEGQDSAATTSTIAGAEDRLGQTFQPLVMDNTVDCAAPTKKLRPQQSIDSPMNCLNYAERLVYEAMESHRWEKGIEPSKRTGNVGSPVAAATGSFAAIGYCRLCNITGLAKRTVQRAILRLIEKRFIAIDTRSTNGLEPTTYRVYSRAEIRAALSVQGWTHWRKVGGGVRPVM
jgi:hypothetical protein